jgi:hypothetical protein
VDFATLGKLHGRGTIYYEARDIQIKKESGDLLAEVAAHMIADRPCCMRSLKAWMRRCSMWSLTCGSGIC